MKLFAKLNLFLLGILLFSSCSPVNNTIVGLTPKNLESNVAIDLKTKGSEFSSMANHSAVSNGGFRVSSTLGDKNSAQLKTSQSGKYKVAISIEGELSTLKK